MLTSRQFYQIFEIKKSYQLESHSCALFVNIVLRLKDTNDSI